MQVRTHLLKRPFFLPRHFFAQGPIDLRRAIYRFRRARLVFLHPRLPVSFRPYLHFFLRAICSLLLGFKWPVNGAGRYKASVTT